MNGFDREIKNRLLRVVPHITVARPQGFSADDIATLSPKIMADVNIRAVVPMVQSFAMLSQGAEQTGVMLQGIDPQLADAGDAQGTYDQWSCWSNWLRENLPLFWVAR